MKLTAQSIFKSYKGRKVVNDISIEVNQGEIVGLLGPNGAGKTTSFYMIVGLIKPDGGKISLDNLDITTLPMYMRALISRIILGDKVKDYLVIKLSFNLFLDVSLFFNIILSITISISCILYLSNFKFGFNSVITPSILAFKKPCF